MNILEKEQRVLSFLPPLSLYFGPNQVLINLDVSFADELTSDDIERIIDRIESQIKAAIPEVNRIYIEAETLSRRGRIRNKEII